jgi:hypothetical protein
MGTVKPGIWPPYLPPDFISQAAAVFFATPCGGFVTDIYVGDPFQYFSTEYEFPQLLASLLELYFISRSEEVVTAHLCAILYYYYLSMSIQI